MNLRTIATITVYHGTFWQDLARGVLIALALQGFAFSIGFFIAAAWHFVAP